jgi:hypothetical protein
MSVDEDSLQFGRNLTNLVPSRCPAAVAAEIGGYLRISFLVIPGSTVPSSRILRKLGIGIEHAQP